MQTVSCPSCGAPVAFRSHASVMAVCAYCAATVIKDGDAVKDLGKMSSVLEDFSPIQIGTSGSFGGLAFSVIGRIQLRYDEGIWNEWYLLFDDASVSWLGDSSGLYTLTTLRNEDGALPAFTELQAAKLVSIAGQRYTTAEVREADCIGGQGELPFKVGQGWHARVADFRAGASFVTLDYSDGERPALFTGAAVTLDQLQCQMLRDEEQIKTSAGKYKGKVDTLACPECGGNIAYLPGVTAHLICPSCHAQLGAAGPKALVLAAGERVEAVKTTLALGATARINGADHQVIGLMRRVDEEGSQWTEYLLYNTRAAFFWLVETDQGWSRANVLSTWPQWHWSGSDSAELDKLTYKKLVEYNARVTFAAGAFNWRVRAGDKVRVHEFENGQTRLAAEITEHEMTWSRSTPLAYDQLRSWFGKAFTGKAPPAPKRGTSASDTATKFIWWILGLNAIPLLLEFSRTWMYVVLAILAIYLPAKFLSPDDQGQP